MIEGQGDGRDDGPRSLVGEQQQLTRDRIGRAAMEVVAKRGFDATVDEIAQLSGVSPRTIFRHYVSHDRLIAATVKDMFEACGHYEVEGVPRLVDDLDGWIEGLPRHIDDLEDLDAWLERVAVTIHTRTARIFGEAFWDIHAPTAKPSEALADVAALRRRYRRQGVGYLAGVAWRGAGGTGDPPPDLVLAFALNLSAFTTQALMIDFDQSPEAIGVLAAAILGSALREAVASSRPTDDDPDSRGGPR